ncbi:MAG: PEP-CTERM sorting domain-containing protein, partial [Bryobacteraceae bacterium]
LEDRAIRNVPRRRRTWYRRHLRRRRILAATLLVTVLGGVCALNLVRILSQPGRGSHWTSADLQAARNFVHEELGFTPPHARTHPRYFSRIPNIYPYSVVPGGVRNAATLRELTARDRAVARHYSHFDFKNARLERTREPRDVYVSYRIRDTIFWTRKKIHLPAGELLLTDGKITARAKCGNQISDAAKPEVSDEEPAEDVMDQPVAVAELAPPPFPMRPNVAQDLPIGVPTPDTWMGGFVFPYAPILAGPPLGICVKKDGSIDKKCNKGSHGPPTPEPGTMALFGTGLAMVVWRFRARGAASRSV